MRLVRLSARVLCVAIPAGFLAVFFLYPVGSILVRGIGVGGLERLAGLPGRASFRGVVWFTLWQAVASTALAVLVAWPGAHLLARRRFRGRAVLRAAATVPFVLPTVVVGGAFLALFERIGLSDGPLRLTRTVGAILAAHVFFNVAIVLRTVGTFWEGLDSRPEEQARVLGATPWQAFRWVTLPRLWPAVAAAASIVFLFCFTSFGVILILGGPTRATLETEVWRHAVFRGDLASATALAVVQLVAVTAMVVVANRMQRRRAVGQRPVRRVLPRAGGRLLAGNLGLLTLVLGLPIAVLVERSLASGRGADAAWSMRNYAALADRVDLLPISALGALRNSLLFAVVATGLAVLVGGLASVVVVHGRREAAAVLGASPARVRRDVDLPIAARALAVGGAFSFAVSLGEFGATSFLPRHPDRLTAPLALFRLLGTPGEALRGQAMALAVVLMVLTAASVLAIEGWGRRGAVRGDL